MLTLSFSPRDEETHRAGACSCREIANLGEGAYALLLAWCRWPSRCSLSACGQQTPDAASGCCSSPLRAGIAGRSRCRSADRGRSLERACKRARILAFVVRGKRKPSARARLSSQKLISPNTSIIGAVKTEGLLGTIRHPRSAYIRAGISRLCVMFDAKRHQPVTGVARSRSALASSTSWPVRTDPQAILRRNLERNAFRVAFRRRSGGTGDHVRRSSTTLIACSSDRT